MKNILFALTLLSAANSASAASLVGNTVTCAAGNFGTCSAASAVVGNAQEFNQYEIGYDFTATGLTLTNLYVGSQGFGGNYANFVLNFANFSNPFTTATLGNVNNVSGIQANTFSLTNGVLSIGLGGLSFDNFYNTPSANFSINLGTVSVAGAVPEPASWAMLILGMAAIGYAMRRSNVKVDARIKGITAGAIA